MKVFIPCGKNSVEGELYLPKGKEKFPLVLMCHALGGSKANFHLTAEAFCRAGIGAFAFDFRGGGNADKSGFPTAQMTLFTEKEDLECVFKHFQGQAFVGSVSLFGASQGGMVAAMFAEEHAKEISSLVLLYPGFCIADHLRAKFPREEIPETFELFQIKLGRDYVASLYDYDTFRSVGKFPHPVLIFHGDKDPLVPLSYSQRAAEIYPNAKLLVLEGEGHGFTARGNAFAAEKTIEFFRSVSS